jgi:hypothetical protein
MRNRAIITSNSQPLREGTPLMIRVAYGLDTGSIENADQMVIVNVPDGYDMENFDIDDFVTIGENATLPLHHM